MMTMTTLLTTSRRSLHLIRKGSSSFNNLLTASKRKRSLSTSSSLSSFTSNNSSASLSSSSSYINKRIYNSSLKCTRLGWYQHHQPDLLLKSTKDDNKDIMNEYLMKEGIEFEKLVYKHNFGYYYDHDDGYDDEYGEDAKNKNDNDNDGNNRSVIVFIGNDIFSIEDAYKKTINEIEKIIKECDYRDNSSNNKEDDTQYILLQPTFISGNTIAKPDAIIIKKDTESNDNEWTYEVIEIKSSTDKSIKKHMQDLSFSVFVTKNALLSSCMHDLFQSYSASLIVVNSNYIKGNDECSDNSDSNDEANENNCLYKTIDCTNFVNSYIDENELETNLKRIDEITTTTDQTTSTLPIEYKLECGKCDLFYTTCYDKDEKLLEHGIWELPRLSQKRFMNVLNSTYPSGSLEIKDIQLHNDNYSSKVEKNDMNSDNDNDIINEESSNKKPKKKKKRKKKDDNDDLLTKNQKLYCSAVKENSLIIDDIDLLRQHLHRIDNDGQDNVKYLDFESVILLNPPYIGMKPYEAIVTQYSMHHHVKNQKYTSVKDEQHKDLALQLKHSEFLSDPQKDCRKELLLNLLIDLGYKDIINNETNIDDEDDPTLVLPASSILVYSPYEKTQLKSMSKLFPKYTKQINHAIGRLVDLEKIIKDCGITHPHFYGRTSIKVVLPALVPKFINKYNELGHVNNGGVATVIYAKMMKMKSITTIDDNDIIIDGLCVKDIRKALLEYCKLDSLALVEIHNALKKLI